MMRIRLAISDGGYVADVTIPPFQKMPEVVVWGERFFAFHVMLTEPEDICAAEYREVFAYFIPPEVKG
jgi:hypothetical protein